MAGDKELEELAILTNERIVPKLVLDIEKKSFVDEPAETREGIEFMLKHGTILAINEVHIKAVAESITLQNLLGLNLLELPPESPLKMIWKNESRNNVLSSVQRDYPEMENYHYAHGI